MSDCIVSNIVAGGKDCAGADIVTVYAKVTGRYAVYRTADQVAIQFADKDEDGANQRAALAPLAALRGEIDGMIAAIEADGGKPYQVTKAKDYSRQLGLALAVGLQGNPPGAIAQLQAIKARMSEDRASDVRTWHVLYAAAATAALIVLSRLLTSDWFAVAVVKFGKDVSPFYWNGAAIGAIGALFSIALQIRSREVPTDLQPWDNALDAVLRIFVGATSGALVIALLRSDIANLSFNSFSLNSEPHGLILAAFVAGFAERMVSTFLSGLTIASAKSVAGAPAAAPPAPAPGVNEMNVANGAGGRASPAPSPSPAPAPEATSQPPAGPGPWHEDEGADEPDEDEDEAPGTPTAPPASNQDPPKG